MQHRRRRRRRAVVVRRVVSLEKLKRIRPAVFCAGMSNFGQSCAEISRRTKRPSIRRGNKCRPAPFTNERSNECISGMKKLNNISRSVRKNLYESPRPSFDKIGLHQTRRVRVICGTQSDGCIIYQGGRIITGKENKRSNNARRNCLQKGHFRDGGNEKRRATALFEDWTSTNLVEYSTAMQVAFPRLDLASSRGAVVSAIYNIAAGEYLYYETTQGLRMIVKS